jgi:hypothetical protein
MSVVSRIRNCSSVSAAVKAGTFSSAAAAMRMAFFHVFSDTTRSIPAEPSIDVAGRRQKQGRDVLRRGRRAAANSSNLLILFKKTDVALSRWRCARAMPGNVQPSQGTWQVDIPVLCPGRCRTGQARGLDFGRGYRMEFNQRRKCGFEQPSPPAIPCGGQGSTRGQAATAPAGGRLTRGYRS